MIIIIIIYMICRKNEKNKRKRVRGNGYGRLLRPNTRLQHASTLICTERSVVLSEDITQHVESMSGSGLVRSSDSKLLFHFCFYLHLDSDFRNRFLRKCQITSMLSLKRSTRSSSGFVSLPNFFSSNVYHQCLLYTETLSLLFFGYLCFFDFSGEINESNDVRVIVNSLSYCLIRISTFFIFEFKQVQQTHVR